MVLKVYVYRREVDAATWLIDDLWRGIFEKFAQFLHSITHFCRKHSWPLSPCSVYMSNKIFVYPPWKCTLLHLRLLVRCWVELISWGNDAAEHSIAWKNYNGIQSGSRCSPDIAYYYSHLHPGPLIQIQIRIRPRCLSSLPELQLWLHLGGWMWV